MISVFSMRNSRIVWTLLRFIANYSNKYKQLDASVIKYPDTHISHPK